MLIAGRELSGIGLGTAPLAFREGSEEQAIRTIHAAIDAGVELLDTALAYTRPQVESYAEAVIAKALRGMKNKPLVATKGGHWMENGQFPIDGRPETLRAHCKISLKTLGVERLDLYQLHHVDPKTPLTESVGALAELQAEGLIGAVGLSNVSVEQLDEASKVTEIASVQNRLSLTKPDDLPMARLCAERAIAYLAYQPLDGARDEGSALVKEIAQENDASVYRVMIAWLQAASSAILPLVGASKPESIIDSARPLNLSENDLERLGRSYLK